MAWKQVGRGQGNRQTEVREILRKRRQWKGMNRLEEEAEHVLKDTEKRGNKKYRTRRRIVKKREVRKNQK